MRFVLWMLLAAAACGGVDRPDETPTDESAEGERGEVLISTDDALIGSISDLVVDEDGVVYAVDRQASQIHVIEGTGEVRSLGRPGAGPGEFSQPSTALKRGDTLLVVDWGNGRLQGLGASGASLFSRPLPPGYPPSLGADGRFVRPTLGADSALAVVHGPDLAALASIGEIEGVPTNRVQVGRMKQEIREGKVPDIFLNTAEGVIGEDSATWLYVPARGSIQRFDPSGEETLAITLEEPEQEAIFARFVSENAARPGGSFAGLRYIADATAVGADLWVLLGGSTVGAAAIRIVHPDGRLGKRFEFPGVIGASQLAVDLDRGVGYFVKADEAELVRVLLENTDTPLVGEISETKGRR